VGPPFRLEILHLRHDVVGFTSGNGLVDGYLHNTALLDQSLKLSTVRVAVDSAAPVAGPPLSVQVIGFFTLSPTLIRVDQRLLAALGLPGISHTHIGGFLLGMLGVEGAWQGQGIGSALVARALEYAQSERQEIPGAFLAVDAETEKLVQYYEALGFTRLSGTRKVVRRL